MPWAVLKSWTSCQRAVHLDAAAALLLERRLDRIGDYRIARAGKEGVKVSGEILHDQRYLMNRLESPRETRARYERESRETRRALRECLPRDPEKSARLRAAFGLADQAARKLKE